MYLCEEACRRKEKAQMVSSLWLGQSGASKYLEKDEQHRSELKEEIQGKERDEDIEYLKKMKRTDSEHFACSSVFLDLRVRETREVLLYRKITLCFTEKNSISGKKLHTAKIT
ncbi:hypothetical protein AMTR_s00045p00211730 [Amborella trichopoda]|uniref:Uncharacterized protein n=1 Tax=Amborella trichopoda TaxID=13333 RepID=W1P3S5_AMBTC|nr:hypothetical protein AMTR_s00045p00211730 [Amborella trichopoda]